MVLICRRIDGRRFRDHIQRAHRQISVGLRAAARPLHAQFLQRCFRSGAEVQDGFVGGHETTRRRQLFDLQTGCSFDPDYCAYAVAIALIALKADQHAAAGYGIVPVNARGFIQVVDDQVEVAVTVKIRSGWNEFTRDPVDIALRCQDAGVDVLTLHPRTRTQMYKGEAQWHEIAAVKEALDIPVIGNGDLKTVDDAVRMLKETNCDGLMIARGSFGNPWVFQRVRDALEGREPRPEPTPAERFAVATHHAALQSEIQGNSRRTAVEFRKHLGWYVRGMAGAADMRRRLHEIESMDQIREIFDEYRGPMVAVG